MPRKPKFHQLIETFRNSPELQDVFRYNQFINNIEFRRTPEWDNSIKEKDLLIDNHILIIKYYLSKIHDLELTNTEIGEACFILSQQYKHHPIKNYLESLKWDKKNRLEFWIVEGLGSENNTYIRDISKNILIAAINRIYHPGCKFDHMLILEGKQGIGKSTFIELLANHWHIDTTFENKDKEIVDIMIGSWFIEIGEMAGMNKKEIDWLKAFITRKEDKVRLAYAKRSQHFGRTCIFVGTRNQSGHNDYLRDDTGNRRFWPAECKKIDIKYIKDNRDQIWAEAYERYKNNEKYYITNSESLKILHMMHKEREVSSPMEIKIERWLRNLAPDKQKEVDMSDILDNCLAYGNKGHKDRQSAWSIIGRIMKKLRWVKGTNENRTKYYPQNGFYAHKVEAEIANQWED